jgi:D-glycero-alpha-D-manno-heptose-7-phosphate kinase
VHLAISVRAPLRIALGGGGTDLPSHYRRHGGFVVSAAIDRHVRMRVSAVEGERWVFDHLEREEVADPSQIAHPILRAALARYGSGRPLKLTSAGDVEPGTGLGSSGAYTVAAVKALAALGGRDLETAELAEAACRIEIDDLDRTVGKQDQYAAAHGGLNAMTFERDESVQVERLAVGPALRLALRDRFLLFFTGSSRSAAGVLAGQVERSLAGDGGLERNLAATAEVALAARSAMEADDPDAFAQLMDRQWDLKRERLSHLPMGRIEELRGLALASGAGGAMLMGAGGVGYLLVYAPEPEPVRAALHSAGAPELAFDLDESGCQAQRE